MAETPPAPPAQRRLQPATIALAGAALIAIGVVVYSVAFRGGGAPAADANASAIANGMAAGQAPDLRAMVAELMEQVRRNPVDDAGWSRLGMVYREMNDAGRAVMAFRRARELQPRNADYTSFLAEALLIQSTQNRQPPPAEADQLLRQAVTLRPGHPQARFYLATMKDMRGDHRGAVDDLIALLRDAPPGEAWQEVRDTVTFIAQRNNIDIANRLPAAPTGPAAAPAAPAQSVATAAIPGPTPDQMRAAGGMTPTQQSAMGREMVERLAARLRQNPRDASRWIMLMRSRMVLNEPQLAQEALRNGLAAFPGDTAAQNQLRQAARELGISGG